MKSFNNFLIEEKSKTVIHKLKWLDADQFTGAEMSFKKKMKIAAQYSKRIGQGSARDVFEVDYEKKPTVMKIAKNEKGFRQNLAEVNIYKKFRKGSPWLVPMLSYDSNDNADVAWIHLMKATPFDEGVFYRYFDNVSFKDFSKALSAIINKDKNEHKDNKKIKEFVKFVDKAGLVLGEFMQKSNFMTYQSKPVIIDAGVTKLNQWEGAL